jgi:hypothetical protein
LLELEDFAAWAVANDTPAPNDLTAPSFQCDLIIDGETTVKETLQTVASCGRAAPARKDSKFTILLDDENRIPVQLITPKNSSGLSSTITYTQLPHALKLSFLDEQKGYATTETIVYNEGYSLSGGGVTAAATQFESMNLPGTTRHNQAQRLGRYYFATAKLQRERVTLSMDFENLICQRGDLVLLANDLFTATGAPRRISKVESDPGGAILTLDEPVSGGSTIRLRYDMQLYSITHLAANVIQLPNTAPTPPQGDLIEYGATTSNRAPYTVEQVTPGSALSAQVMLVEYTNEINESIIGPIPPPPTVNVLSAPRNLRADQIHYQQQSLRFVSVNLHWLAPASGFPSYYNVYRLINGIRYYAGRTNTTQYTAIDTVNVSTLQRSKSITYEVEPVVDRIGPGPTATVTTVINPDRTPPPDVTGLSINVQGDQSILMWDKMVDLDLDHFQIRYSVDPAAAWENAMVVVDSVPRTATTQSLPFRPGRYFIKAVDAAGNFSVNASTDETQTSDVSDTVHYLTVALEPFTTGTYSGTEINGTTGALELSDGFNQGYYTPPDVERVILPGTMKIRLYSSVDLIVHSPAEVLAGPWFDPLAVAVPLSPTQYGRNFVDAQIEFRYKRTAPDNWSAWDRLMVADVTAVEIQFRLKLLTQDLDYKPSVNGAQAALNWKQRTEAGADIDIALSGTTLYFQHPFADPPAIVATLQNSALGDQYQITNITRQSFDVELFDSSNASKAGIIDWVAYGHGEEF